MTSPTPKTVAEEARALRVERQRFNRLAAATGIGVWYCDLPFADLVWDDKVKEHFWLPADAHVTIDTFYERIHPEDRERTRTAIQHSNEGRAPYNIEYRTTNPKDVSEYKWIRAIGWTDYDAQGTAIRFDGVTLDVTEQKANAEALLESRDFERHLIGIVSHDLRAPLSAMLMAASVILRRNDLDHRLRTTVERIISSGSRANRMIRDLLDFAQARGTGTIPVERVPLDLAKVISQLIEEIQLGAPNRTIRLQQIGDAQGQWDPDRIAQIVTNLVGNAVEHSPPDTTVNVRVEGRGDLVALSVHNEGDPIQDTELPMLFEAYKRGKGGDHGSHKAQGIGLGLFITKKLVEAKGGSISVHSTAQEGTTFTVLLPRMVDPSRPLKPR